jgi:hypothetical protein
MASRSASPRLNLDVWCHVSMLECTVQGVAMDDDIDLLIEVRFCTEGGVPVELVTSVTKELASAVHSAEEQEIDAMFAHFQEWTFIERDTMRYRFDKLDRDQALIVEYGGRGSLLLFAAAAGLAYWVADKTLGET